MIHVFDVVLIGIALIFLYILFKLVKDIMKLIINSVLAMVLWFIAALFGIYVPLNLITFLFVLFTGIPGLLFLILLKFLGVY